MWASIMHLAGIQGRVLTLDIAEPTWDPSSQHWGGIPRADATKHELWAKYVTFLKVRTALAPAAARGDGARAQSLAQCATFLKMAGAPPRCWQLPAACV